MFRVRELESVDSTNNQVKCALEAGEAEGLVVRALRQTGGYGRQGRAWSSPFGGMYQSLLLRPRVPMAQLPTLSLVVGASVREALSGLVSAACAPCIKVKWPNDVVYVPLPAGSAECPDAAASRRQVVSDARQVAPDASQQVAPGASREAALAWQPQQFQKLCGISLEAHAGGVCVGIGVNVVPPEQAACADEPAGCAASRCLCRTAAPIRVAGKNVPAYLADLGLDATCVRDAVSRVGDAVLQSFALRYDRWREQGFAACASEYSAHAALDGRAVRIANIHGDVTQEGVVAGVDEHGRLLVRVPDGTLRPVMSGEAHIL